MKLGYADWFLTRIRLKMNKKMLLRRLELYEGVSLRSVK